MVGLRKILLALGVASAMAGAANAAEYAANGKFDTLAPGVAYGDDVTVTSDYGNAAANAFPIYNFYGSSSGGTTVTELLSSFSGRSNILHITSDGGGIFQMYSGAAGLYGYADVFVVSGAARFYMCSGYCGVNNYNIGSTVTGAWQRLNLTAPGFTDELSLYATPGAAEFYVDTISISNERPPVLSPAPEAATWLMMIFGFATIGAALRRRDPVCSVA